MFLVHKENGALIRRHVEVNHIRWDGDVQNENWKREMSSNDRIHLTIRFVDDSRELGKIYRTTIQKRELLRCIRLTCFRIVDRNIARDINIAIIVKFALELHKCSQKALPKDSRDGVAQIALARSIQHF